MGCPIPTPHQLLKASFIVILATLMIPEFLIVSRLGLLNKLAGVIVPSLAISYFNGIHAVHPSYVMAAAVLIMLPVLIVYLIFQRRFVEGLALSGLK
jgi:ABC-type glycerol-3-phosphate transport system permease component